MYRNCLEMVKECIQLYPTKYVLLYERIPLRSKGMGMYFCPFFLFLCFCNIVLCCLLALEFGFVAVFLIFVVLNL